MIKDEKDNQKTVYNQTAWILNYQPKIEHQHINGAGGADNPVDNQIIYEYVNLKFFDAPLFTMLAGQNKFRSVLGSVLPRMDVDNGRDWIAPYIAYHYYKGREFIMKGYGDFFTDIDGLLPGILTKRNDNEKGDRRYKNYTDLLRLECPNWFILDECLPPMNEWTSNSYKYNVDNKRRKRIQQLVREIYQGLKK